MAVQKQDGLHTDVAESAADLRGKETRFCSKGADGRVNVSGAGAYIDGVISEGKNVGLHTSYNTEGNPILRVMAGAALARNAYVGSDAEGRAIVATANIFGRVRNPVGAAGELAEIHPTRILDAVDDVV
jgi:hypothetical protein